MSTAQTIVFNGITFRRYPDSQTAADRRYYKPSGADRKRGVGALHQEVWKAANGRDIPAGHHVHHADHDADNNDPSNLVLITASDHASHHGQDPARRPAQLRAMGIAQEAAKEWHGTDEGLAWHSEHAREIWANKALEDKVCEHCGETYSVRTIGKASYCSNRCKSAARRESGVDDETRQCAICGERYTCNRYSKGRTCSRKCRVALRASPAS